MLPPSNLKNLDLVVSPHHYYQVLLVQLVHLVTVTVQLLLHH